jgi:hypothetical protein
MTRKHYNDMADRFGAALAEVDNAVYAAGRNAQLAVMKGVMMGIDAYCQHAKAENPRFDRDRFLDHINNRRTANA